VTTERECFGAHDGGAHFPSPVHDLAESFLEFQAVHVIRIAAEPGLAPGGMRRIAENGTASAQ